jgi:hypothetical protein
MVKLSPSAKEGSILSYGYGCPEYAGARTATRMSMTMESRKRIIIQVKMGFYLIFYHTPVWYYHPFHKEASFFKNKRRTDPCVSSLSKMTLAGGCSGASGAFGFTLPA